MSAVRWPFAWRARARSVRPEVVSPHSGAEAWPPPGVAAPRIETGAAGAGEEAGAGMFALTPRIEMPVWATAGRPATKSRNATTVARKVIKQSLSTRLERPVRGGDPAYIKRERTGKFRRSRRLGMPPRAAVVHGVIVVPAQVVLEV